MDKEPIKSRIEEIKLPNGGLKLSRHDRLTNHNFHTNPSVSSEQYYAARVITAAWGDRYVEDLLALTVPALLAPGNLPAFARCFKCELVIVTETRLFDVIASSEVMYQLLYHCDLRLVPIDDLLSSWYGMTLTYAFVRGFSDLGKDMCETHLVFLNADFVIADGSYAVLAEAILRGERLIIAPSYCMVHEDTIEKLGAHYDRAHHSLAIERRDLAAMVITNRHNTVRAKTVNQQLFRLHVNEQFYWYVDEQTLLARQLHTNVVYMRPERVLTELLTYWDYGLVSECCPTTVPCVLSDSDDFLMAELRTEGTFTELLHLGWPNVDEIAAGLSSFTTKDHRDYGRTTVVLHSADLPLGIEREIDALGAFVDAVYERMSPPVSYLNHPFWAPIFPDFLAQIQKNNAHDQENSGPLDGSARLQNNRVAQLKGEIRALKQALGNAEKESSMRRNSAKAALLEAEHLSRYREIDEGIASLLEQTTDDIHQISGQLAGLRKKLIRLVSDKQHEIRNLTGTDAAIWNRVASLRIEAESLSMYRALENEISSLLGKTTSNLHPIWDRLAALRIEAERLSKVSENLIESEFSFALKQTTDEIHPIWDRLATLRKELVLLKFDEHQKTKELIGEQALSNENKSHDAHDDTYREESAVRGGLIRRLYRILFGQLPRTTKWHPYHTVLHPVLNAIVTTQKVNDVLLVSSTGPRLFGSLLTKDLNAKSLAISPEMVISGLANNVIEGQRKFQLCVCDIEFDDLLIGRHLLDKIRPHMSERSKIIVFHHNSALRFLDKWTYNFTRGLFPLFGKSQIRFTGSRLSAFTMRLFEKALQRRGPHWQQLLYTMITLVIAAPLSRIAAWIEEHRNSSRLPVHCTSMTIEIDLP